MHIITLAVLGRFWPWKQMLRNYHPTKMGYSCYFTHNILSSFSIWSFGFSWFWFFQEVEWYLWDKKAAVRELLSGAITLTVPSNCRQNPCNLVKKVFVTLLHTDGETTIMVVLVICIGNITLTGHPPKSLQSLWKSFEQNFCHKKLPHEFLSSKQDKKMQICLNNIWHCSSCWRRQCWKQSQGLQVRTKRVLFKLFFSVLPRF